MDNKEEEYNHVQYCNNNSVVVVSPAGRLKQVFTPFKVLGKSIEEGKQKRYVVEEVWSVGNDQLVYVIAGVPYPIRYFIIDVHFE